MTALKSHYSAAELAQLKLAKLPGTVQGIGCRAKIEQWTFKRRAGRGGGVEYAFASLPVDVQTDMREQAARNLVKVATPIAVFEQPVRRGVVGVQQALPGLNDQERLIKDARKSVLLSLERIRHGAGCSQEAALTTLLTQAAAGHVEPQLLASLRSAKTARGRKSSSDLPSHRTLMRWLALDKCNALAPKKLLADMTLPAWAALFLALYRQPHKPTVVEAYKFFKAEWEQPTDDQLDRIAPSIHAVRRFLEKLPADLLARGRHTGAELKALLPYVQRDWSVLRPNDVWIGDGHGLKAKVAHPDHGKPFVPEVTLIVDGASRMVMGWSVAYAENQIAVGDAIRHGVIQHGKPLMYYSDNGAGQTAKSLDDPTLGCLPRLAIHHETGIPGSPQGRGIIERIWQTITIPLARQMPTFRGAGMDNQTLRKTTDAIESALKRGEAPAKLPTWDQFIDALELAITEYNTQHEHSSLARNPATNRRYTPAAFYAAHVVAESIERPGETELLDLFRPYVQRVVERGWVRLWNNRYFAAQLAQLENGTEVRVGYDIHDANQVVIRDLDGVFICTADWNGNRKAAFPVSQVDRLAGQRADRMTNRGQEIIDRANAERTKTYAQPAIEQQETISIPGIRPIRREELATMASRAIEGEVIAQPAAVTTPPAKAAENVIELASHGSRWDRWWRIDTEHRDSGEFGSEEDKVFWRQYQKSPEYRAKLGAEGVPTWVAAQASTV